MPKVKILEKYMTRNELYGYLFKRTDYRMPTIEEIADYGQPNDIYWCDIYTPQFDNEYPLYRGYLVVSNGDSILSQSKNVKSRALIVKKSFYEKYIKGLFISI